MRTIVYCLLLIGWCACQSTPSTKQPGEKFAFAFFTDVHLGDQNHVGYPGLRKALANAKCKQVDFILLGGDNVDIDGLVNQREVALERYGFYKSVLDSSGMAIYPAIGNHDRYFGDTTDVIYYDGLFKQFFGDTYYSFDHKGWHFITLNSVQHGKESKYPCVNEEQLEWLKKDLATIGHTTPVVVTLHVPILSMYYPAVEGYFTAVDMITNFKQVWDILADYNLQIVLQGHQHLYEDILVKGNRFVTGGAICASWWSGAFHGTEEGYVLLKVDNNDQLTYEYVDYGWEAKKNQ